MLYFEEKKVCQCDRFISGSYTEQMGLPYFDRASVIAIGSWYYVQH